MTTVVITRPRHPLEGQSLTLLGQMRRHGRLELLLVLPDGSKSLIPAAWTDQAEPTEIAAAPATVGTLADLQDAVGLVATLLARLDRAEVQAARHPPSQEDDRATCTAEFAAGPGAGATTDAARRAARASGRGSGLRARPADRHRRPQGDEPGGRR